MRCCWRCAASTASRGQAFNIGGGPGNTLSLLELLDLMSGSLGLRGARGTHAGWRSGDQRYYVTDSGSSARPPDGRPPSRWPREWLD